MVEPEAQKKSKGKGGLARRFARGLKRVLVGDDASSSRATASHHQHRPHTEQAKPAGPPPAAQQPAASGADDGGQPNASTPREAAPPANAQAGVPAVAAAVAAPLPAAGGGAEEGPSTPPTPTVNAQELQSLQSRRVSEPNRRMSPLSELTTSAAGATPHEPYEQPGTASPERQDAAEPETGADEQAVAAAAAVGPAGAAGTSTAFKDAAAIDSQPSASSFGDSRYPSGHVDEDGDPDVARLVARIMRKTSLTGLRPGAQHDDCVLSAAEAASLRLGHGAVAQQHRRGTPQAGGAGGRSAAAASPPPLPLPPTVSGKVGTSPLAVMHSAMDEEGTSAAVSKEAAAATGNATTAAAAPPPPPPLEAAAPLVVAASVAAAAGPPDDAESQTEGTRDTAAAAAAAVLDLQQLPSLQFEAPALLLPRGEDGGTEPETEDAESEAVKARLEAMFPALSLPVPDSPDALRTGSMARLITAGSVALTLKPRPSQRSSAAGSDTAACSLAPPSASSSSAAIAAIARPKPQRVKSIVLRDSIRAGDGLTLAGLLDKRYPLHVILLALAFAPLAVWLAVCWLTGRLAMRLLLPGAPANKAAAKGGAAAVPSPGSGRR